MTTPASDPPRHLPAPAMLVGLIALASAAALMLEIVAGRMVAPFVGMSLHSWTAIIAVVLAGLSLGALLGGRLADGPPERGRDRLVASLGLAALFTLLTPVLLRRTASLTGAGALDPTLEVLVLATAMLLVPSVFAGIVSPLATRLALAQTATADTGRMLGRIFAAGAAGSIVGTLLAGFVLIGYLGSLRSVVLIAVLYAIAALASLGSRRRLLGTFGLLAAGGGAAYGAGVTVDAWRPVCEAESAYSCIRIEERRAPGVGASRVLVIDHLTHGINVRDAADHFVMGYIELVDLLARQHAGGVPERSFFLGGGAYTLPRAWLAAGGTVVVAELDPLVTEIAERRLWLEPSARLAVRHRDARLALAEEPPGEGFDVIFGDAFQDVTVPPHLVTREFAALVRERLTPDGLYVVNVIDRAERPLFAAAVARSLEASFAAVEVWREVEDNAAGRRVNHVLVAGDRPLGLAEVRGGPPYRRLWTPVTLDGDGPLLTDDHSPVERLLARRVARSGPPAP